MIDIDTAIRAALAADSERAPAITGDWIAPNYPTTSSVRGSRTRLVVAAAAAAVALIVTAMVALQREDSDSAPAVAWQPSGVEVPLREYEAPEHVLYLTVAGLARTFGIDGRSAVAVQTALSYRLGRTAELERCVLIGSGGNCGPVSAETPGVSRTAPLDQAPRDSDVWIWRNVPAGTAIVTYHDGAVEYWQRPNGGVAIFPLNDGRDEFAIAHTTDGTELARASIHASTTGAGSAPKEFTTPNSEQYTELTNLTYTTLEACLTQAGATSTEGSGIARLPVGVDEAATWSACVGQTQQTVAERVQAMGLQFTTSPQAK